MSILEVVALAGSALVQDLGRSLLTSGVPLSGAFDREAHSDANELVGNAADEATIELVGTLTARLSDASLIAVTGGVESLEVTRATGLSRRLPVDMAVAARGGAVLTLRARGRAHLAVRGGLAVRPVLGSRSTCLLGPLGPPALVPGTRLLLGDPSAAPVDARPGDYRRPVPRTDPITVIAGPHGRLARARVEVLDTSRIGVRLRVRSTAPAEPVHHAADLPSFGVLPGAIQALPTGDWMVLGPDCGTMGGYPVVAVLATGELDRIAQALPGDALVLRAQSVGSVLPPAPTPIVRVGHLA